MYPGAVAAEAAGRPALVTGAGDVLTYGELDARINQLAHLLRRHGLSAGDGVAVLLENHPRFLEIAWAAQLSGLYYTAINRHLTADEAAYIVNDSGARVLISSAHLAALAGALDESLVPKVEVRLMLDDAVGGWDRYETAIEGQPTGPLADAAEGESMLYSSGTTGRPKGILRPLTLAPPGEKPDPVVAFLRLLGFGEGDVYLCPAPLYHAAPLAWTMAAQRIGGTVVLMDRFDPAEALRLIEEHRVTHAQFVPTMFVRLLKMPERDRSRFDVSSLKAVVHAGAPCPVGVKHRIIDWWGPIVSEYYSATEGMGATFVMAEEWLAHPGTVGRAILGTVHILDDAGHELPPGETGTVWFGGGLEFEYHNDPEKTAEARDSRGYATVGDVGHLDEEGYLYLTDRRTYMIISGGVNIYPQEAENVLVDHDRVLDAAVFGVPDEEMGEAVKAVVQPVDWDDAGPALEAELLAFCRERLAAYKCPRSVDFERALPRLDTGKLYKRLLRDRYWPATG
jgi:acyl-CoA synthetase (AMP-forming)/AMP-acid ligase II